MITPKPKLPASPSTALMMWGNGIFLAVWQYYGFRAIPPMPKRINHIGPSYN